MDGWTVSEWMGTTRDDDGNGGDVASEGVQCSVFVIAAVILGSGIEMVDERADGPSER